MATLLLEGADVVICILPLGIIFNFQIHEKLKIILMFQWNCIWIAFWGSYRLKNNQINPLKTE